jgi:hypothetical protein
MQATSHLYIHRFLSLRKSSASVLLRLTNNRGNFTHIPFIACIYVRFNTLFHLLLLLIITYLTSTLELGLLSQYSV